MIHEYEEYVAYTYLADGQIVWLARVAGAPRPYGPSAKLNSRTVKFNTEAEARHAAEVLWKTAVGEAPTWKVQMCETRVSIPDSDALP